MRILRAMEEESMEQFELERVATEIGTMLVVTDAEGRLRALDWVDYEARMRDLLRKQVGAVTLVERTEPSAARTALERYMQGDLKALDALEVVHGGTPFQRRVWAALRAIPIGQTISYGELAKRLDMPTAARAVGLANGQNAIGIVVPCHRVIGANSKLTGYAGGLERKRWLLEHERA
ncbi:MAG TPA: methylated-DNA--[protein]-cysteine S-methyltransferase [Polyangiales bacterium]|nr:methylated-DNA--[protein]-cysteine S-methyltransferase [Polyangiales bacterium]